MRVARNLALIAVASLGLAACLQDESAALPDAPQGIYGNVTFSEYSGDLGGFEVEFKMGEDGMAIAEFVLCEGWCNSTDTSPVERVGDSFVFTSVEQVFTVDSAGNSVPEAGRTIRYKATPRGEDLVLRILFDGVEAEYSADEHFVLRPLEEPYGLLVARDDN